MNLSRMDRLIESYTLPSVRCPNLCQTCEGRLCLTTVYCLCVRRTHGTRNPCFTLTGAECAQCWNRGDGVLTR